jgi:hypothetical protein
MAFRLGPSETCRVSGSTETSYLVRVSHQFAVDEDAKLSQPVTVDLANILYQHKISGVTEMSLTANQPLSNVHRLVVRVVVLCVSTDPVSPLLPAFCAVFVASGTLWMRASSRRWLRVVFPWWERRSP